MKTSNNQIENKFNELVKLSGLENTAKCISYLAIDYAPVYGGRRLVMVRKENGGHFGAFGQSSCCTRMKPGEFYLYLCGLCEGIENNISKNKSRENIA